VVLLAKSRHQLARGDGLTAAVALGAELAVVVLLAVRPAVLQLVSTQRYARATAPSRSRTCPGTFGKRST
jgi:hypothetical protein